MDGGVSSLIARMVGSFNDEITVRNFLLHEALPGSSIEQEIRNLSPILMGQIIQNTNFSLEKKNIAMMLAIKIKELGGNFTHLHVQGVLEYIDDFLKVEISYLLLKCLEYVLIYFI
jgi:hypothetical protein